MIPIVSHKINKEQYLYTYIRNCVTANDDGWRSGINLGKCVNNDLSN